MMMTASVVMMTPSTQPRCGFPVTRAACCPGCQHQDGSIIHSPPSLLAVGLVLGPAASPLMESGSSPTLCLSRGGSMLLGSLLPGYFSWGEGGPTTLVQNCSPPPRTLQLLTSVCLIGPRNNCVVPSQILILLPSFSAILVLLNLRTELW